MRRGNAEEAKQAKGGGTVTLIGAPEAQAQGLCRIMGVHSGVDGEYRVSEATVVGRDVGRPVVVSIHAPAREATAASELATACPVVSIHAPAREATFRGVGRCRIVRVSIHAPAREATTGRLAQSKTRIVSIHAPAREATADDSARRWRRLCFNPRPRAGGDPIDPRH